jgi:hypothetical protein
MQQADGTAPQSGGFVDPGLAALIAALLSSGIGGYGFISDKNRSDEAIRNDAIASMAPAQTAILREAEAAKSDYAKLKQSNAEMAKKNAALSKEVEELKFKYSRSLALSGPSATFQKASVDTIKNSVDATIQALQSLPDPNYAWMQGKELANLRAALAYPTTALVRPSLSNFYDKVILPAAAKDKAAVGGTSRRRRYRRNMRGSGINDAPDTSNNAALNEYVILVDKAASRNLTGPQESQLQTLRQKLATFDEGKETLIAKEPDMAKQMGLEVPGEAAPAAEAPGEAAQGEPGGLVAVVSQAETPTATLPFFPPFEEFAKLYENSLQGSLVSVKQQAQAESQKRMDKKAADKAAKDAKKASAQDKKDNEAAVKAAEQLAIKFNKALKESETKLKPYQELAGILSEESIAPYLKRLEETSTAVKTFIPEDSQNKLPAKSRFSSWYDRTEGVLATILEAALLAALITNTGPQSMEGGFSLFKSSSLVPVATKPLPPIAMRWDNVKTAKDWNEVQTSAQTVLSEYMAAVDAYIAAVEAAKQTAKKGFTLESRKLFDIPKFKWSPSNPFAGTIKKLAESKNQSKALAEQQARFKELIQFIKGMVEKAEKVLPELKDFGYAAQEEAEAKMRAVRSDKATRIGRGRRRRGGAENPDCALIKQDKSYTNGDLLWFYSNIRAVLNGGDLKAGDTKIKWVPRRVDDPSKDSPRTALKFLLAKLDTGFLSGTKTWFRGVFGKMQAAEAEGETPEATTFLENALLAGEAFIILKCLVDKAVELVNAQIKSDSVVKKNARLAARNKAISAERATAQMTASELQKKIQGEVAKRQTAFDTLQKQVIDASAILTPYTKSTGEGGRSTTPEKAVELTTALGILQAANGELEKFRETTGFQSFFRSRDEPIPSSNSAIDEVEDEFATETAKFDAAAEEVYKEARVALENAKARSKGIADLMSALNASVPSKPSAPAVESTATSSIKEGAYAADRSQRKPGRPSDAASAVTTEPRTPASSSPGTPVVAPATELAAPGTSEAEALIDNVFAKDSPAFEGQWPSKLRSYFYNNIVKSTPPESLEWELVFSFGTDVGGEAKDYADILTRALEEAIPKFKTEAAKNAATAIRNYIPTALSLEEERLRAKEKKRAEAQRIRREKLEDPNDTTILDITEREYETLSPEGRNHWERKEIFHPEEGAWIGNPSGSPAYTEVKYIRKAASSSGLVGVTSSSPVTPSTTSKADETGIEMVTVPGRAAELKAATEAETARLEAEARAKADQAAAEEAARAALVPGASSGAPNIVGMYPSARNLTGQPPKARPLTAQAPSIPVPSGPAPPPSRAPAVIQKELDAAWKASEALSKKAKDMGENQAKFSGLGYESSSIDANIWRLEAELAAAKAAEAAKRKGGRGSRKSTLKKRRGGKQNGRRTRRRKNRANRTHSNSR